MPSSVIRQKALTRAHQVVVKLGTQLLSDQDGRLDVKYLRQMVKQIVELRGRNVEVTLVSSGAVGAGCGELGLSKRPTDVAELQAVAAVGQRELMRRMHDAFKKYDIEVGQLLLTRSDFEDRVRFLNIRNCISHLHELGCIAVINENDTVAVDEIRFGDNDLLAALICNMLRADALLLMTVVDGLLDEAGQVIDLVERPAQALIHARRCKTTMGSGGMVSKLEAARLVSEAGEVAVIANGRTKNILLRLLAGEERLGTVFLPADRKLDSRQRWIGLTVRPAGVIAIDDGAVDAVLQRGKSLLATGVTSATGQFARGDVLLVRDARGAEVARGLSNYTADELRLIMGKRSSQFEKILGRKAYAELIHRDNLVLVKSG